MSVDVLRVIDPRGYFNSFFTKGIYPDGRALLDVQKLVYKQGECGGVGSSVVTTHGTTVSCTIEASVSLESDGQLVSVEIGQSQQISEKDSDEYSSLILSLFSRELFIKREALKCRDSSGNKLPLDWLLTVSLKVLSCESNILDAIICAVTSALKDTKLPSIVLKHSIEDESAIEKSQILIDHSTSKLDVLDVLMCCSFGVFVKNPEDIEQKEILLLTPSEEIASVCKATCSVIVGKDNKIVMLRERGKLNSFHYLKKMVQITSERQRRFAETLEKS